MGRTLKCACECFPDFRAKSSHRLLNGHLLMGMCLDSVEECSSAREDIAGFQNLKFEGS